MRFIESSLLGALDEYREQLLESLEPRSPQLPDQRRRALVHQLRVVTDLQETCLTDEEAVDTLQELTRRSGELSWAAYQVRQALGDLRYRDQQSRPPDRLSTVRHIQATLAFDSQAQPQFVGLRTAPKDVRRLLFQAEDLEIDLEITQDSVSERVRLAGQLIPFGPDPRRSFLSLSGASDEWLERLDEGGEFWLEGVKSGTYRLQIGLEDRVIEVPSLEI
jgi:hypothetical protein